MKFIRYAYETTNRKYELNINDEYIKSLNEDLNKRMGSKEHLAITKSMVIAVASGNDLPPECDFVVATTRWGDDTVTDFIHDCLNEDIWDAESEILDGDTEDYTDEVELDPEEEELYKEYVQMNIFDEEGSN